MGSMCTATSLMVCRADAISASFTACAISCPSRTLEIPVHAHLDIDEVRQAALPHAHLVESLNLAPRARRCAPRLPEVRRDRRVHHLPRARPNILAPLNATITHANSAAQSSAVSQPLAAPQRDADVHERRGAGHRIRPVVQRSAPSAVLLVSPAAPRRRRTTPWCLSRRRGARASTRRPWCGVSDFVHRAPGDEARHQKTNIATASAASGSAWRP